MKSESGSKLGSAHPSERDNKEQEEASLDAVQEKQDAEGKEKGGHILIILLTILIGRIYLY